MRLALLLLLTLAETALAQSSLPPRNIAFNYDRGEQNEMEAPIDPSTPFLITLGQNEIFYTATSFQCADKVPMRLINPKARPVQLRAWVKAAGDCHLYIETSNRKYNLWVTGKESTSSHPVAPVASVRWNP